MRVVIDRSTSQDTTESFKTRPTRTPTDLTVSCLRRVADAAQQAHRVNRNPQTRTNIPPGFAPFCDEKAGRIMSAPYCIHRTREPPSPRSRPPSRSCQHTNTRSVERWRNNMKYKTFHNSTPPRPPAIATERYPFLQRRGAGTTNSNYFTTPPVPSSLSFFPSFETIRNPFLRGGTEYTSMWENILHQSSRA